MFIRLKLLKHAYTDSVTDVIFFIVCKTYFLLVLWKLRFEGNNKYAERYHVGMRRRCNFPFLYEADKILFTLQVYFARSVSLKFSEYFSQF